jgi:hypothetical protein
MFISMENLTENLSGAEDRKLCAHDTSPPPPPALLRDTDYLEAMGQLYFDFCRLYPFSPQPPRQRLGPTCHLSTSQLTLYRRCGLAYTYDGRGRVGPKKKTSVVL